MKYAKQLFRHKPEDGIYGDCHRTCIANLLDLEPLDVPHIHEKLESEVFVKMYRDWLHDRGWHRMPIAMATENLAQALSTAAIWADGLPHIFSGESRTGVNHSVIVQHGEIVHDPSLTDAGIIGPCDDGYYWCEFLVRMS